MSILNITDQFDDVNAYDLIYRSPSGYTVKVRVEDTSPSPSCLAFTVTGAWADDMTGRAKAFDPGHFIVEPHDLTIRPDTSADLGVLIDEARYLMVRRVEQAAIHYAARQALSGIKPKAQVTPVEPMSPPVLLLP